MGYEFKSKKEYRHFKLSNQGFSLIEVLVAMAILAVLSLPILSNFSSAAKVNSMARRTENANTVAQKVAENFKVVDLDAILVGSGAESEYQSYVSPGTVVKETGVYQYKSTLLEQYTSAGVAMAPSNPKYDPDLKAYTFKITDYDAAGNALLDDAGRPYVKGNNDEEFYVTVNLNPAQYSDNTNSSGAGGNNVNSFEMPNFQDIDMFEHFVINDEITKYDNAALSQLKKVNAGVTKDSVKKNVKIYAELAKTGINKYKQNLRMSVTYTYIGNTDNKVTYEFEVQKGRDVEIAAGVESPKNVYVVYNVYDTEDSVASDEIEIYYSYPNDPLAFDNYWDAGASEANKIKKALKVFLIEQNNAAGAKLNKANVSVYVNNEHKTIGATYNDTVYIGNGPVSVYSNITDWNKTSFAEQDSKNGITDVYDNNYELNGKKLYTMEVIVYLGDPDNADNEVYRITSTKEN